MSDGLVLTSIDGSVLYANQGASIVAGLSSEALESHSISTLYDTLRMTAVNREDYERALAAIKGHASTLLQEDVTWSFGDQRHFLQTISGVADRLAQLVSNLLDLSRQEAGLLLLKLVPITLQSLVAKVIEQLRRPDVTICSHVPDNLPLVYADSARIEVVLHNLITNAFVYGEGEIHITAQKRENMVVVAVSDNGHGIADDELLHIFERFYRARRGRQQHSGGTGLGLTICKAFIEAHGGAIWAESSVQGTTISFSLPLFSAAIDTPVEAAALARERGGRV